MSRDDLGAGADRPADREHDKIRNDPIGSARPAKFHTVESVARMLEVSARTVRRWIAKRDLSVHRFGGTVRVSDADLKVFLALHRDD